MTEKRLAVDVDETLAQTNLFWARHHLRAHGSPEGLTAREIIQQKIKDTYVPLRKLMFEDNEKKVDVQKHFTNYSYVLANIELIIHSFLLVNSKTQDKDILCALKRIRKDTFQEYSQSEEDELAFVIMYGISIALQHKRLAINEVNALLDWLIHEVEGRARNGESYVIMLKKFFKDAKR